MQIGNVGSGDAHTANSHHVTDCVHGHREERKINGAMNALPYSAQKSPASHPEGMRQNDQGSSGMSALERMRKIIAKGRKLIGRLWNGPDEELGGSDDLGVNGRQGRMNSNQISSDQVGFDQASSDMEGKDKQNLERMAEANPMTAPVAAKSGADAMWQRFKLKVYTATGYLAKRFGHSALLQSNVKENQSRQKGKYRDSRDPQRRDGNGREDIEAVPADRSYLMDSYDKTGKYVRLGQESGKKRQY